MHQSSDAGRALEPDADSKEASRMMSNPKQAVREIYPLGFPWKTSDPFLFCVHHDDSYPKGNKDMGPAVSLAGRNIGQDFAGIDGWRMYHGDVVPGFPRHPHRGFETVTVVRTGLLDHSDSLGATARYGGGDVQWLTAGKGINHAEMFPLVDSENANPLELFQIWLNLPRVDKMVDPYFTMLWDNTIPKHSLRDAKGKAIHITTVAGRYGEADMPSPPPSSWASNPDSNVAIWTIKMEAGAKWTLPSVPAGVMRNLYFFRGSGLKIGGQAIPDYRGVELADGVEIPLHSGAEEIEMLLLQGRPIGEPVSKYGPFVMNTRAEIEQAYTDYRRTEFGGWPWDRDDHVHPRTEGRFAQHADGKKERPT